MSSYPYLCSWCFLPVLCVLLPEPVYPLVLLVFNLSCRPCTFDPSPCTSLCPSVFHLSCVPCAFYLCLGYLLPLLCSLYFFFSYILSVCVPGVSACVHCAFYLSVSPLLSTCLCPWYFVPVVCHLYFLSASMVLSTCVCPHYFQRVYVTGAFYCLSTSLFPWVILHSELVRVPRPF